MSNAREIAARFFGRPQFKNVLTLGDALKDCRASEPNLPPIDAHALWVDGNLSNLEKICINSFLRNGFIVNLWTYGVVSNCPQGIVIRNASDLVPESKVFRNKFDSYASFADLFRYALLSRFGGLWFDTDVICHVSSDLLRRVLPAGFLVTERTRDFNRIQINNNLIYHPNPKSGDVMDLALALSNKFDRNQIHWDEIGPRLLTMLLRNYPALSPVIMAPSFANPINYWDCPKALLEKNDSVTQEFSFLHCYNEMWKRSGVDKDRPYPADSVMALMADRFLE